MFLTEMVIDQMNKKVSSNDNSKKQIILFQSINNEQILLPELGLVNVVQAYLQYHKILYVIDERTNVEYMSPDGELPLIKYGPELVSGYKEIIDFINSHNNLKTKDDSDSMKLMGKSFNDIILKAESYYTWLDKNNYEQYTKINYSYGKPWPLNEILCWLKRRKVASSIENVENMQNELDTVLENISTVISNNHDDEENAELLCLVYGHIKAILSLRKTYKELYEKIDKYPSLKEFVSKFENRLH